MDDERIVRPRRDRVTSFQEVRIMHYRIAPFAFLCPLILALVSCVPRPQRLVPHSALVRARARGLPVVIYRLDVPGVHPTHGGRVVSPVDVDLLVTATHAFERLRLTLEGYDGLGLPVIHRPGHPLALVLTLQGPFEPGENYEATSAPEGFPGAGVSCVELREVEIWSRTGLRHDFVARRLNDLLAPGVVRRCPDRGPTIMIYGPGRP